MGVRKEIKIVFEMPGWRSLRSNCFHTRVCGLDGYQEVHHRLLPKHAVNKSTGVLISGYYWPRDVNVD